MTGVLETISTVEALAAVRPERYRLVVPGIRPITVVVPTTCATVSLVNANDTRGVTSSPSALADAVVC